MTKHNQKLWTYTINHGPDGQQLYAFVYDEFGVLVGNLKTQHALKISRALNSHDALVDALKAYLLAVKEERELEDHKLHKQCREALAMAGVKKVR